MSLVTRCPACATTFKVVRDQLRISDGWVRCGRCSEIFDANTDLHEHDAGGVLMPVPSEALPPEGASAAPVQDEAVAPVPMPMPAWPDASALSMTASPPAVAAPAPAAAAPKPAAKLTESLVPPPAGERREPSLDLSIHWPAADMLELPTRPNVTVASTAASTGSPAVWSSARAPGQPVAAVGNFSVKGVVADEPWMSGDDWPSVDELFAGDADMPTGPRAAAAAAPGASATGTPLLVSPSPIEEAVNSQLQKALRRERVKALRQERAEQKERERELQAQQIAAAATGQAESAESAEPPELVSVFEDDTAPMPASFAAPPARRRSALRTTLLLILVVLGCAGLLVQYALYARDTLAARQPALRPLLQQLCDLTTGCQVSALRQIGAITIDGASFLRENGGDGYRLLFTLRNAARMPLAMPAVELSLLDSQERVVVRRVLQPAEFGAPAVLAAGAERSAALPIELSGPQVAALPPVAGYRVVAFYP